MEIFSRITDKNREYCDLYEEETGFLFDSTVYEKLKKYENFEEELGITLDTLLKALENGIYTRCRAPFAFRTKIHKVNVTYIGMNRLEVEKAFTVETKDYGVTWALTKEELI